jgi:hypothetical protein
MPAKFNNNLILFDLMNSGGGTEASELGQKCFMIETSCNSIINNYLIF